MPLLTPNVPKGLIDLMKSLTKEVLRDKPENIYEYAAVHFEKQLHERDGSVDKDYEMFTAYERSFQGQQRFIIPVSLGFKCHRPHKGSGSRRSKPDILLSFKAMESIHEEDDLYSDEKYQKAIYVIQRYYRRYVAKKKISASIDKQRLTEATAAIIIQRTMRKLFANKFPSRSGRESARHSDVPQEDVDNVSEAASYTSSSTIQMLADSQEGRENRLTMEREEIADDSGVADGDGSTTVTQDEPPASQNSISVEGKQKETNTTALSADRKSMADENDESDISSQEKFAPDHPTTTVSDDTSTAPIGILSTKIGSNDQQNFLHINTVEVAKDSNSSEPTHAQTSQDVAPIGRHLLESPQSLESALGILPVTSPSRPDTEESFTVRLQKNEFVDNNAGYSVQSVGPNRRFVSDIADPLRAYNVFYQDRDDTDFSDSLNESTMERDSLETEDLDVDSLESNETLTHAGGIVKREVVQVSDSSRDGDAGEEEEYEEQQNAQASGLDRVPSYLYGIHPTRTPVLERRGIKSRKTLDGENSEALLNVEFDDKCPDEKSEEESMESKESTSEESSATQIENILEASDELNHAIAGEKRSAAEKDDALQSTEDAQLSNSQDALTKITQKINDSKAEASKEMAALDKAGKDERVKDEADKDETVRDEAEKEETGKDEAFNDKVGKDEKEAGKAETVKHEADNDKAGKDETVHDEAGKDETVKFETFKVEAVKAETVRVGAVIDKAGKDETVKDEADKDETVRDEAGKDETIKYKPVKDKAVDEAVKDKAGKDETVQDESVKDETIRVDAVTDKAGKDETVKDVTVRDEVVNDKAEKDKKARDEKETDKVETVKDEADKDVTVRDEAGKDETVKDEAVNDKAGKDETVHDEAGKDEAVKVETFRVEAAKAETVRVEAVNDKAGKDETVRDEAGKDETIKHEQVNDKAGKDETVKDEAASDKASDNKANLNHNDDDLKVFKNNDELEGEKNNSPSPSTATPLKVNSEVDHVELANTTQPGYFATLYNIHDTMPPQSEHQDSEVESQLKELKSLCNLYPGLEIKDVISEFHTKHIQPEERRKDSVYDDNNNVEDFEFKSSDVSPENEDEGKMLFEDSSKDEVSEVVSKSNVEGLKSMAGELKKDVNANVNEISKDFSKSLEQTEFVSEISDKIEEASVDQLSEESQKFTTSGEVGIDKEAGDKYKNSNEADGQNAAPTLKLTRDVDISNRMNENESDLPERLSVIPESRVEEYEHKSGKSSNVYAEASDNEMLETEAKEVVTAKESLSSVEGNDQQLETSSNIYPEGSADENLETKAKEAGNAKESSPFVKENEQESGKSSNVYPEGSEDQNIEPATMEARIAKESFSSMNKQPEEEVPETAASHFNVNEAEHSAKPVINLPKADDEPTDSTDLDKKASNLDSYEISKVDAEVEVLMVEGNKDSEENDKTSDSRPSDEHEKITETVRIYSATKKIDENILEIDTLNNRKGEKETAKERNDGPENIHEESNENGHGLGEANGPTDASLEPELKLVDNEKKIHNTEEVGEVKVESSDKVDMFAESKENKIERDQKLAVDTSGRGKFLHDDNDAKEENVGNSDTAVDKSDNLKESKSENNVRTDENQEEVNEESLDKIEKFMEATDKKIDNCIKYTETGSFKSDVIEIPEQRSLEEAEEKDFGSIRRSEKIEECVCEAIAENVDKSDSLGEGNPNILGKDNSPKEEQEEAEEKDIGSNRISEQIDESVCDAIEETTDKTDSFGKDNVKIMDKDSSRKEERGESKHLEEIDAQIIADSKGSQDVVGAHRNDSKDSLVDTELNLINNSDISKEPNEHVVRSNENQGEVEEELSADKQQMTISKEKAIHRTTENAKTLSSEQARNFDESMEKDADSTSQTEQLKEITVKHVESEHLEDKGTNRKASQGETTSETSLDEVEAQINEPKDSSEVQSITMNEKMENRDKNGETPLEGDFVDSKEKSESDRPLDSTFSLIDQKIEKSTNIHISDEPKKNLVHKSKGLGKSLDLLGDARSDAKGEVESLSPKAVRKSEKFETINNGESIDKTETRLSEITHDLEQNLQEIVKDVESHEATSPSEEADKIEEVGIDGGSQIDDLTTSTTRPQNEDNFKDMKKGKSSSEDKEINDLGNLAQDSSLFSHHNLEKEVVDSESKNIEEDDVGRVAHSGSKNTKGDNVEQVTDSGTKKSKEDDTEQVAHSESKNTKEDDVEQVFQTGSKNTEKDGISSTKSYNSSFTDLKHINELSPEMIKQQTLDSTTSALSVMERKEAQKDVENTQERHEGNGLTGVLKSFKETIQKKEANLEGKDISSENVKDHQDDNSNAQLTVNGTRKDFKSEKERSILETNDQPAEHKEILTSHENDSLTLEESVKSSDKHDGSHFKLTKSTEGKSEMGDRAAENEGNEITSMESSSAIENSENEDGTLVDKNEAVMTEGKRNKRSLSKESLNKHSSNETSLDSEVEKMVHQSDSFGEQNEELPGNDENDVKSLDLSAVVTSVVKLVISPLGDSFSDPNNLELNIEKHHEMSMNVQEHSSNVGTSGSREEDLKDETFAEGVDEKDSNLRKESYVTSKHTLESDTPEKLDTSVNETLESSMGSPGTEKVDPSVNVTSGSAATGKVDTSMNVTSNSTLESATSEKLGTSVNITSRSMWESPVKERVDTNVNETLGSKVESAATEKVDTRVKVTSGSAATRKVDTSMNETSASSVTSAGSEKVDASVNETLGSSVRPAPTEKLDTSVNVTSRSSLESATPKKVDTNVITEDARDETHIADHVLKEDVSRDNKKAEIPNEKGVNLKENNVTTKDHFDEEHATEKGRVSSEENDLEKFVEIHGKDDLKQIEDSVTLTAVKNEIMEIDTSTEAEEGEGVQDDESIQNKNSKSKNIELTTVQSDMVEVDVSNEVMECKSLEGSATNSKENKVNESCKEEENIRVDGAVLTDVENDRIITIPLKDVNEIENLEQSKKSEADSTLDATVNQNEVAKDELSDVKEETVVVSTLKHGNDIESPTEEVAEINENLKSLEAELETSSNLKQSPLNDVINFEENATNPSTNQQEVLTVEVVKSCLKENALKYLDELDNRDSVKAEAKVTLSKPDEAKEDSSKGIVESERTVESSLKSKEKITNEEKNYNDHLTPDKNDILEEVPTTENKDLRAFENEGQDVTKIHDFDEVESNSQIGNEKVSSLVKDMNSKDSDEKKPDELSGSKSQTTFNELTSAPETKQNIDDPKSKDLEDNDRKERSDTQLIITKFSLTDMKDDQLATPVTARLSGKVSQAEVPMSSSKTLPIETDTTTLVNAEEILQLQQDQDKSTIQKDFTASSSSQSTQLTGVDENTAETSADFSSIGKDLDFFEDTIHFLKSATAQLSSIGGIFEKKTTDGKAESESVSKADEMLSKAAVIIQSAIRGYRVRRAFKEKLSSKSVASKRVENSIVNEGMLSIPVAIIHPTKQLTEDQKTLGGDKLKHSNMNEQASDPKSRDKIPDSDLKITDSECTRSEIPRLKREKPLERKAKIDESAVSRVEAKVQPVKAMSLETKPRLTREKPIERNPRSVKGERLDGTKHSGIENKANDKRSDNARHSPSKQKKPSDRDVPGTKDEAQFKKNKPRIVSSSDVPERHRLTKSKRDQFAKKGKSLSTNAQTQKPLVFDLEAIKKDLLTKKTISQSGKKTRMVARRDQVRKKRDSSKSENVLNDTAVVDQRKSSQSNGSDSKNTSEKDPTFQDSSSTCDLKGLKNEAFENENQENTDSKTTEMLIQEASAEQTEGIGNQETAPIESAISTDDQNSLNNEFDNKSDKALKMSGKAEQGSLKEPSGVSGFNNETSKSLTDQGSLDDHGKASTNETSNLLDSQKEDEVLKIIEDQIQDLSEKDRDSNKDETINEPKTGINEVVVDKATNFASNCSPLVSKINEEIPDMPAAVIEDSNKDAQTSTGSNVLEDEFRKIKEEDLNASDMFIQGTTVEEDKVKEVKEINEKSEIHVNELKNEIMKTEIAANDLAKQSSTNEVSENEVPVAKDHMTRVDQIEEAEDKPSSKDGEINDLNDETLNTETLVTQEVKHDIAETTEKPISGTDSDKTEAILGKPSSGGVIEGTATDETKLSLTAQTKSAAEKISEKSIHGSSTDHSNELKTEQLKHEDLDKPAIMIQKTFRGYKTRQTLNNGKSTALSRENEATSSQMIDEDEKSVKIPESLKSSKMEDDQKSIEILEILNTLKIDENQKSDEIPESLKSPKMDDDQKSAEILETLNTLKMDVESFKSSVLDNSATVIQKNYRGYRTRCDLKNASETNPHLPEISQSGSPGPQNLHDPDSHEKSQSGSLEPQKLQESDSPEKLQSGNFEPQILQEPDSPGKPQSRKLQDSAVVIQKTYRGYKTRKDLDAENKRREEDFRKSNEAAIVIQKSYKGYKTRKELKTQDDLKYNCHAPPNSSNVLKSISANALLESAAGTIQKAYRNYHDRRDPEIPIKSYSHGAQREHACKDVVENSDESSIFIGPDTSFDLSDVESVEAKSEQVSDTSTFVITDEKASDAISSNQTPIFALIRSPGKQELDSEMQPQCSTINSLSVEQGIRRKRSIIDPTAPLLEDILRSDEASSLEQKPQWYVGDDPIIPTNMKNLSTEPSTSQQNPLDSSSSSRFENSSSLDARLEISNKQPTPSIQSAVVSTSSLLFPNDTEMHDTDTFKQFTKPSRAVSAEQEEANSREHEEKEEENEENAEKPKLDDDTARDGSSEKGEKECTKVMKADPFSVMIKIEDLSGLPNDEIHEIEAEVCRSCADGIHEAGMHIASPRRKSIEEISREIDEQNTNVGDTKDDTAGDSGDKHLDKIEQFVLMEEANKAGITESTNDQCKNINDNNGNKIHNDPDLASSDETNKISSKDDPSASQVSRIQNDYDKQEEILEKALDGNKHMDDVQRECPAINLFPPSSEDDVSEKEVSMDETKNELPQETVRETGEVETIDSEKAVVLTSIGIENRSSDKAGESEESGSTDQSLEVSKIRNEQISEQSETVQIDKQVSMDAQMSIEQIDKTLTTIDKTNCEAKPTVPCEQSETKQNSSSSVEKKSENDELTNVKDEIKDSDLALKKEAGNISLDLKVTNDVKGKESSVSDVLLAKEKQDTETVESVDKETLSEESLKKTSSEGAEDNANKVDEDLIIPVKQIQVSLAPKETTTESSSNDAGDRSGSSDSTDLNLKDKDGSCPLQDYSDKQSKDEYQSNLLKESTESNGGDSSQLNDSTDLSPKDKDGDSPLQNCSDKHSKDEDESNFLKESTESTPKGGNISSTLHDSVDLKKDEAPLKKSTSTELGKGVFDLKEYTEENQEKIISHSECAENNETQEVTLKNEQFNERQSKVENSGGTENESPPAFEENKSSAGLESFNQADESTEQNKELKNMNSSNEANESLLEKESLIQTAHKEEDSSKISEQAEDEPKLMLDESEKLQSFEKVDKSHQKQEIRSNADDSKDPEMPEPKNSTQEEQSDLISLDKEVSEQKNVSAETVDSNERADDENSKETDLPEQKNSPTHEEQSDLRNLDKEVSEQNNVSAKTVDSNETPDDQNSIVNADIVAKLDKLIDDTCTINEKDSSCVQPEDLPTKDSSQEVVEELCIKKIVPFSPSSNASEQEESEIESTTTKADSTTTSVAYDETSEIDALDNPPSLHDTLEKATEALRESEAVVARMHNRRDSEQKASIEHVDQLPVFGDIACEPIKSMQELQKPSSPEIDDDIILQNLQQGDTTRESSAQSESVIFGDSSTQFSESDDVFNDNFDLKTLHRMNTVAVDHSTYKAPNVLFKSVTIDDTVKYIDPEKSTEESGGSFCLDDALTADVRKKMMAYSISEADSDYYEPGERSNRRQDDFNISTALDKFPSSDTDTTIISAATKIQAGARGFLTRRRLRRASMGTRVSLTDGTKASFGNDAIGESLDRLEEEEVNKRSPKVHYQRQVGVNSLPSALGNSEEAEIVHSTTTRDESTTLTTTTELLAPSPIKAHHGQATSVDELGLSTSSDYDVNGGMGALIDESSQALSSNLEATLAARRLTLQRGDAMRNDSAPDDDNGNGKQVDPAKITIANTGAILIHQSTLVESTTTTTSTTTEKRTYSDAATVKKMEKIKWFAMRQNSMPVQIDSEVFRVLPKHMRKRIKSAEGQQKKRIRLPRD